MILVAQIALGALFFYWGPSMVSLLALVILLIMLQWAKTPWRTFWKDFWEGFHEGRQEAREARAARWRTLDAIEERPLDTRLSTALGVAAIVIGLFTLPLLVWWVSS
jgi:hypothetical protein